MNFNHQDSNLQQAGCCLDRLQYPLSVAPGASGDVVTVSASTSTAISVPATVNISSNTGVATFNVSTFQVSVPQTVTITATFNGSSQTATLTVNPFAVSALVVSPTVVNGGNTATGIVTLSQPVGASSVSVNLTSSSPDVSVPASISIPAGSASTSFVTGTRGVAKTEAVTITATVGLSQSNATLTLTPAVLSAVTVSPSSIYGGTTCSGSVILSGQAPPSGLLVKLTSSISSAGVPASVSIPSGSGSATFSISTHGVSVSTTAKISATLTGSSPQAATLTILPPVLEGFTLSANSIVGGSTTSISGSLSLAGLAGPSGLAIALSSSNAKFAAVPATIKVASGASTISFPITHLMVTSPQTVTLIASANGVSQSVTLIVDPFQVQSLSLSPSELAGGTSSAGIVTLNASAGPKSGNIAVNLASSSLIASVPSTINVVVGSTTGKFAVKTSSVATSTAATISALLGTSSKQATLTVNPLSLASISVSPGSVKGSSATKVIGTVTLTGPAPTGGITILLSSSNASAATLPASVTIPAGKTSATINVSHSKVSEEMTVTLTATLGNGTRSATLTVSSG